MTPAEFRERQATMLGAVPHPRVDRATANRQRLVASIERPPGGYRLGWFVLGLIVVCVTTSAIIVATRIVDDIRETRKAVERCR